MLPEINLGDSFKNRFKRVRFLINFVKKGEIKIQGTSCEFRYTSYKFKSTRYKFKSTS